MLWMKLYVFIIFIFSKINMYLMQFINLSCVYSYCDYNYYMHVDTTCVMHRKFIACVLKSYRFIRFCG